MSKIHGFSGQKLHSKSAWLRHCSFTTCDRSICSALLQGDGEFCQLMMQFFTYTKLKEPLFCDVFVVSNFLDQFMWNISGGPMLNKVLNWSGLIKQYVTGKGLCQILRLLNRSRTKLSLLLKFCCQIWLSEVSLERSFLAICSSDASTLSHRTPQSKVDQNPFLAAFTQCMDAAPGCFQNMLKPEDVFI